LWNIYPFLTRGLQRFQLSVTQRPGQAFMTIFAAITAKSPHILTFTVYDGRDYGDPLMPHISTALCGLLHLSTVECPEIALTRAAISHLAALPNLREVDIRLPNILGSIKSLLQSPFPALTHLTLNCENITPAIEFVRTLIQPASLVSFSVWVEDFPSSTQLAQIFSLLLAHSSPEHLTYLHVKHPEYITYGDHSPPLLDAHSLNPLLKFSNLESLVIETEGSIAAFDDNHLEVMATSWPKLRQLWLTPSSGNTSPSQCTLRGILALARHCPNLMSLGIVFQASADISWNGRPGGGIISHMHSLEVGRSPISDPHVVASFLSDIFPGLESIVAWENYDPDDQIETKNYDQWKETVQLFHSYVVIRNEERTWAAAVSKNKEI
jgi:hypothetical protein